ncbi:olfactory protein-like isoform X2 [Hyperolius riggenbachi]
MDAEYHKEADGIYTYSSDLGKNEVIMAASDYTTYQMEYMTTEKDGKSCTTIKIGGRTPGMPKDKEGQFDEHIQKMGLKPENSVKFRDTSEGPCVPKTN